MDSRTKAFRHFKKTDTRFHAAALPHQASLPVDLVPKKLAQLFSALCSIVVSQQLGTKAADAIFTRVKKVCGGKLTPRSVLKAAPAKLRAAGLSGAKIQTIKAIAKAVEDKHINLAGLVTLPDEGVRTRLTEIWGLGPWSAEMFLMFALGRADIFSAGDLGLIRAIEAIYGLPKGVGAEKILEISSPWAPYRTYAALILWRTRDASPRAISPGRHRSS